MSRARHRLRRRRRPAPPPPAAASAAPSAEERLLALARELTEIPQCAADSRAALAAGIDHLARAWLPDTPLPAVVFEAWRAARADESRALSLAFARAQVTLGLQEILTAALKTGHLREDVGPEALAWLVTAGCESLAHGGDRAERARLLVALCAPRGTRGVPGA